MTDAKRRILVVEDEPLVRDLVALNLTHAGYDVTTASNFNDGLAAILSGVAAAGAAGAAPGAPGASGAPFDLALFDVMLPGGDGLELTRRAREAGVRCPILILTARGETTTKVRGLDVGADDYVTKPFDVPELLARVRALLRRSESAASSSSSSSAPSAAGSGVIASFGAGGKYWVRFDSGRAMSNEGEVTLSDKELRLMEQLMKHDDRVLSRADLLEEVWGMDAFPTDRTIDNFILRLRRLFEPDPENPVHILTVRGRGYMFRKNPGEPAP